MINNINNAEEREEIKSTIAGVSEGSVVARPSLKIFVKQKPNAEAEKKSVVLSPDQQELRNIRLRLGMTKNRFASAIGIKSCTLDSYEHGKTKGVPEKVIGAARNLETNASETIQEYRDKYSNRDMSSILKEWSEKLDVPSDNSTMLAKLLNTTPTTIRRWSDNKNRPDLQKIMDFAFRVDDLPLDARVNSLAKSLRNLHENSGESAGNVFAPKTFVDMLISRVKDVQEEIADCRIWLSSFYKFLSTCNSIHGDPVYIQMNSAQFNLHINQLTNILNTRERE